MVVTFYSSPFATIRLHSFNEAVVLRCNFGATRGLSKPMPFNEAAVLAVCNPGASCAAGHGVWPSMRPSICNSAWMDIENIRAGPSMRPQLPYATFLSVR